MTDTLQQTSLTTKKAEKHAKRASDAPQNQRRSARVQKDS
jgi:hypothetical protein